jgi:hypothetical protein
MTIIRTSTAPPQLAQAGSSASLASLAAGGLPTIQATRYDLEDEDCLPSPFLKKKISTGPLRALAQQQASTISGGTMTRAMSQNSIANANAGNAPTVPTRAGRPPTTRQSLATRLAMRRQASADEQGRRMTQA